jgi:hypothetical protein
LSDILIEHRYLVFGVVAGAILLYLLARVITLIFFSRKYVRRSRLLTHLEANSFRRISRAVSPRGFQLMAQVRIADVILVDGKMDKHWWRAFSGISGKHVDFVVVDLEFNILCAIEIDDLSHSERSRAARDRFVNRVFHQAGVPLFRCPPGGEAHVIERILHV